MIFTWSWATFLFLLVLYIYISAFQVAIYSNHVNLFELLEQDNGFEQ